MTSIDPTGFCPSKLSTGESGKICAVPIKHLEIVLDAGVGLIVLTVLAAVWFIIWIIRDGNENDRAKRRTMGFCYFCGYDLRSSPDRCPECGATRRPESSAKPNAPGRAG